MNLPLDLLLSQPEGKTLEFKRDLSSPGNVIKTLVAFANTAGGRLGSARNVVFDEQPMLGLCSEDLNLQALQRLFGMQRVMNEKTLITLKLLHREQNRLVPTQGAILLFGKDRIQHFPDAWVQCARFRGTDKVYIFDQSEIHEPMPDAVSAIELFLKKLAFRSARFGAMRREDVWSIPLPILREAIINALVHSDYSQRGTPIRVAFFDDRIDIESPGMLLPGMTVEDMKDGVSRTAGQYLSAENLNDRRRP